MSNPFFSGKKKLQWLEVENVDTASFTHTHSQTVKKPSPPCSRHTHSTAWQRYTKGGLEPQAPSFLSVAKARLPFTTKHHSWTQFLLSQTSHSTHSPPAKGRQASASLSWEEPACFCKDVNPPVFLSSQMADVTVFYEVSAYLAH